MLTIFVCEMNDGHDIAIFTGYAIRPVHMIRFRLARYLLAEMSDTLWTQLDQLNVEPCIHTSSCVHYALYVWGMHVLCRAKLIINFNTLFYSSVRQLTNEDIQSWLQSYLPLLTDIKDGKVCIII